MPVYAETPWAEGGWRHVVTIFFCQLCVANVWPIQWQWLHGILEGETQLYVHNILTYLMNPCAKCYAYEPC